MTNYPTIYNISEVLPVVKDKEHFVVLDRGDFTIIDYVSIIEGFPELPKNPTREQLIERECRGIAFDSKTGIIISRPFEKFFNYMEKPKEHKKYTWQDFRESRIYEKLDGSMIRPLFLHDSQGNYTGFRLMTRKGITDVAMMAEAYIASLPLELYEEYNRFLKKCYNERLTPIFEFCSKENQVVIRHKEPKLVLLAVRNTVCGDYLGLFKFKYEGFQNIPIATEYTFQHMKTIEEFVDHIRALDSKQEGVVVYMRDGTKLKVKADLYCQLHRIMSNVREERHYVDIFLNGTLDDLVPILDEETLDEIREKFEVYHRALCQKTAKVYEVMMSWIVYRSSLYKSDTISEVMKGSREERKEFHIWLMKQNLPSQLRNVLYRVFNDGVTMLTSGDMILDMLVKSIKTNSRKAFEETQWILEEENAHVAVGGA